MAELEDRESAASKASLNDDIGEEKRLTLYRIQVEIREAEQRAYWAAAYGLPRKASLIPFRICSFAKYAAE